MKEVILETAKNLLFMLASAVVFNLLDYLVNVYIFHNSYAFTFDRNVKTAFQISISLLIVKFLLSIGKANRKKIEEATGKYTQSENKSEEKEI